MKWLAALWGMNRAAEAEVLSTVLLQRHAAHCNLTTLIKLWSHRRCTHLITCAEQVMFSVLFVGLFVWQKTLKYCFHIWMKFGEKLSHGRVQIPDRDAHQQFIKRTSLNICQKLQLLTKYCSFLNEIIWHMCPIFANIHVFYSRFWSQCRIEMSDHFRNKFGGLCSLVGGVCSLGAFYTDFWGTALGTPSSCV